MIRDLSNEIAALQIAYSSNPDDRARVVRWMYTVIRKSGYGQTVRWYLSRTPPAKRWIVLQRLLPSEALPVLARLVNEHGGDRPVTPTDLLSRG